MVAEADPAGQGLLLGLPTRGGDSPLTSVPPLSPLAFWPGAGTLGHDQKKKKNHYVKLACLRLFNWNKMGAPLSGTACAEKPG